MFVSSLIECPKCGSRFVYRVFLVPRILGTKTRLRWCPSCESLLFFKIIALYPNFDIPSHVPFVLVELKDRW